MCRGNIFISNCCGERRISFEERCAPERIGNPSTHRIIGGLFRQRGPCRNCRRRRREETEQEAREYAEATERAKAILEYFRGERQLPLTDAEIRRIPPDRLRRVGELRMPQLADVQRSRQVVVQRGERAMQDHQRSQLEMQPQTNSPQPGNVETPLSFREWTSNQESPLAVSLLQDLENYLRYLEDFRSNINYRPRFLAGAREILQDRNTSLEFVPDDPSGRLISFNSFLGALLRPVPETFGYLGEGVDRYARYLIDEGTRGLQTQFFNFRQGVDIELREHLNILTPAGRPFGQDDEPIPQTFREWSANNPEVLSSEPHADVRLLRDLNYYERSHLGHGPDAGMMFDFQELRSRLRANDVEHFNFYPHVEGVETLREHVRNRSNLEASWDIANEYYRQYLQNRGHPELAGRFVQARIERAQADRREFEGLPRYPPQRRWEIGHDPSQMSAPTLGARLIAIASEIATHLAHLTCHPQSMISVALLDLATHVHNYRIALTENRQLSLQDWDRSILEIRIISLAFSHNNPHEPVFQHYLGKAGDQNQVLLGRGESRIFNDNGVSSISSLDDYVIVDPPHIQDQVAEQGQEANPPPSPVSDMSGVVFMADGLFASEGEAEDELPLVDNPDSILYQLATENEERRGRSAERGMRERLNRPPQTPEIEDGQSEMDPQEATELSWDAYLDRLARRARRG